MKVIVRRKTSCAVPLDDDEGLAFITFDNLFKGKVNLKFKKEKGHLILLIDCDGVEYDS